MKSLLTRRPPEVEDEPQIVDEREGEASGWVTASSGAAANVTAVLRWTAWALLIAGPLVGCAAWLRPPVAVGAVHQPVKPAAVRETAGVGGFAELYVAAYVQAGRGSEASLAPYFPGVRDLTLTATSGVRRVERLAAVRLKEVSAGYWSVTVAAQLTVPPPKKDPAGAQSAPVLRYFQVPVRDAGKGVLVAAALPAEVAAMPVGTETGLAYGAVAEARRSSALVQSLEAVFGAYLTGTGEMTPYFSPGTVIDPVSPAPYTAVTVQRLAEVGTNDPLSADAATPRDGARRQLLVHLEAGSKAGARWPLMYAVELTARDGRWEVAALGAAPALEDPQNEGETKR